MDVKKIDFYLEKLQRQFVEVHQNGGAVSPIERDLLLAGLRELYDLVWSETPRMQPVPVAKVEPPQVTIPTEKIEPKTKPTILYSEDEPEVKPKPTPPPVAKKEESPVVAPPKVVPPPVEVPPMVKVEESKVFVAPKVTPPPPAAVEVPFEVEVPQPPVEEPQPDFNPLFNDLFAHKTPVEFIHKIAETKIPNLKQAMGLNERFLFINDLFGSNVTAFEEAVERINKADSFEEARRYLEKEIIVQHAWIGNEEREELAHKFVKFVHRRHA